MFINSMKAEETAILNLAYSVCAAARTAPKMHDNAVKRGIITQGDAL
jgi:uncharacterized ferredoxin-like protein